MGAFSTFRSGRLRVQWAVLSVEGAGFSRPTRYLEYAKQLRPGESASGRRSENGEPCPSHPKT